MRLIDHLCAEFCSYPIVDAIRRSTLTGLRAYQCLAEANAGRVVAFREQARPP
jgi:hypothetical protein